jgi:uncharacterized protein GlcG (DUF336 family)
MQITAEQAERVLKASILKARELGVSVCIAILDSGGHLKAFHRMDGAWLGVIDVAIKKAKTFAGGIPLKNGEGQIIGSIGVSGGQVTQDYAVAQSGESALKV